MDIRTFLTLTAEERMVWVENLVLSQNPRLRKGERMIGPIGAYKHGKTYVPTYTASEMLTPDVVTVQAKEYLLTDDNIDGHPFLDIDVGGNNFLHMYEVKPRCALGEVQVGDVIKLTWCQAFVNVTVTQQMIDEHTTFIARFALSK